MRNIPALILLLLSFCPAAPVYAQRETPGITGALEDALDGNISPDDEARRRREAEALLDLDDIDLDHEGIGEITPEFDPTEDGAANPRDPAVAPDPADAVKPVKPVDPSRPARPPVPGTRAEAARAHADRLAAELERARRDDDRASAAEMRRAELFRRASSARWARADAVLRDGKTRTREEWREAIRSALDDPLPPNAIGPGPNDPAPADPADGLREIFDSAKPPPGLSAEDLAGLRGKWERERAAAAARIAAAKRNTTERRRELAPLEDAVRRAEAEIARVAELDATLTDGQRSFLNRELERKLREAREARDAARARHLDELRRRRAGNADIPKSIEDIARAIAMSGHGAAPTGEQMDADGLPLPEWMRLPEQSARVRAKVGFLERSIARTDEAIAALERKITLEDRRDLYSRRLAMESVDRHYGRLDHPYFAGLRRAREREITAELDASRAARIAEARAELEADKKSFTDQLAAARAALAEQEAREKAAAPAPPAP